jgi:antitoxin PrlF
MPSVTEAESTLTDRYQTTVPETVRSALRLGKRDKLRYTIGPDGDVRLSRVDAHEDADPALGRFLSFLEQDIAGHPERLHAVDADLVARIHSLVGEVEADLDAPLAPEDE